VICPKCGEENRETAAYCGLCLERFTPLPTTDTTSSPVRASMLGVKPGRPARTYRTRLVVGALIVVGISVALGLVLSSPMDRLSGLIRQYSVSHYSVRFSQSLNPTTREPRK